MMDMEKIKAVCMEQSKCVSACRQDPACRVPLLKADSGMFLDPESAPQCAESSNGTLSRWDCRRPRGIVEFLYVLIETVPGDPSMFTYDSKLPGEEKKARKVVLQ